MLNKPPRYLFRRLIIVLAVPSIMIFGMYLLITWPYLANPAKGLSDVAVQFAKSEGLIQMKEYNGAATGMDNTVPFYDRIYRGVGSIDELEPKYKAALARAGYTVEDTHFAYNQKCPFNESGPGCPSDRLQGFTVNGGQPYWVLRGKNSAGDTVDSELSSVSYFDSSNTLEHGEHPVPNGSYVLTSSFTSHK